MNYINSRSFFRFEGQGESTLIFIMYFNNGLYCRLQYNFVIRCEDLIYFLKSTKYCSYIYNVRSREEMADQFSREPASK